MKHLVSQSDTLRDKVSRNASRVTYSFNPHPTMHNPKVGELLILFLKAPWLESIIVLALRIVCSLLVISTLETKSYSDGIGAS